MSRKKRSDGLGFDVLTFTLRVIVWGGIAIFVLGLVVTGCEALGRGLDAADAGGGDARATVTVAAAKETTSELRAEIYAQALDAGGYRVERSYGLEGWEAATDAFERSGGAFVFPVQSAGGEPESFPVSGATMLQPTEEAVEGEHLAPLVGARVAENAAAVEALGETTAALSAREFAELLEAVEKGTPVVGAVVEWRQENGLPPAPGVRPAPAEEEERRA